MLKSGLSALITATLVNGLMSLLVCTNQKDKETVNVLLIAIDDYRPDIHALGNDLIVTPNIDRLVREGIYFNRAYCQWPVCAPSRASFMTGLRPEKINVFHDDIPIDSTIPDRVTLPGHFRNAGYYTVSVGKVYHHAREDSKSWNIQESQHRSTYGNPENQGLQWRGRPLFEWESLPDESYEDGKITVRELAFYNNSHRQNLQ